MRGASQTVVVKDGDERHAAARWAARTRPPSRLTPSWDRDPERHHLALDGAPVDELPPGSCAVLEADVEDIKGRLTYASTRDVGPWHQTYRMKTAKTAYRWVRGLPVTPPLFRVFGGEIHIAGGMHRFHLATLHAERVEFLALCGEANAIAAMLPSASFIQPCQSSAGEPNAEEAPAEE